MSDHPSTKSQWLIERARKYMADGFARSDATLKATQDWERDADNRGFTALAKEIVSDQP